jgi:hypothetical protein
MKDQRIPHLRRTLEDLMESLDATARLSRWDSKEAAPEPLRESAAKLGERLCAANRLAAAKFVGAAQVVASLAGMSGAIKRLDAAYVQYRHRVEARPSERDAAGVALDEELGGVKAEVEGLIGAERLRVS